MNIHLIASYITKSLFNFVPLISLGQDRSRLPDPPLDTIKHVAGALSSTLGLSLLGFDVVTNRKTGQHAIIDVNYFPGTLASAIDFHRLLSEANFIFQDTLARQTSRSSLLTFFYGVSNEASKLLIAR